MTPVDIHELFADLVASEPALPDFVGPARSRGRRRRRIRAAVWSTSIAVVVVVAVVGGLAAHSSRTPEAPVVSAATRAQLLALADQFVSGCGAPAIHVQAAYSTYAHADEVTYGQAGQASQPGADRPVWTLLITGGPYTCPHPAPPGSDSQPTSDIVLIYDAATMRITALGLGDNATLNGLNQTVLR